MTAIVLARGMAGHLYFAPLEAASVAGLAVVGIAVLTPEQEELAREIAEAMLQEAATAANAA